MKLSREYSQKSGVPLDMADSSKMNKSSRWTKKGTHIKIDEDDEFAETQSDNTTTYLIIAGVAAIAIGAALAIKMKQNA